MNLPQVAFAIGMIATGVLNFANRDFYSPWDPIPKWIPAHGPLAYAYGAILVLGGVGLAFKRTSALSARGLLVALLLFLVLLKTPILLGDPKTELEWLDYGEIATMVAGAWTLAATSETQVRAARYLLGAALIPIGLSHFFYLTIVMPMVPAILPYHAAWVIFTGTAHIAAGLALMTSVLAPLAANLEAGMLTAFAVLVWLLPALEKPSDVSRWVQVVVTIAVANSVWPVAYGLRPRASRPAPPSPD